MRIKSTLLLILALTLFSPVVYAWGLTGHRVVGAIADRHLKKKAQRKIGKILGNESMAMAANWADFIKSDTAYNYLSSWHYANFSEGLSFDEFFGKIQNDHGDNIHNRLNFLKEELKNNPNLTRHDEIMYLKLIIHLVGDLHQPMHAGRPTDLGGNKVTVYWFNTPTNLHRLWDEHLIDFQQLSYTEYVDAIDAATKSEREEWASGKTSDWLFESYQIAEDLYKNTKPEEYLSYQYNFTYVTTLNKQLLKGGIRLAAILNEIYT